MARCTYDYIQLIPSGDVYAVEMAGSVIVQACGPLHYSAMPTDPADTDLNVDDVPGVFQGADGMTGQQWRLLSGAELAQYLAGQYERGRL